MSTDPSSAAGDTARRIAAEEELQSFSYIVSHDLAASFRHISMFSRLLLEGLPADLTQSQRGNVRRVHAATENCQLMMDQLLAYSRVQQEPLEMVDQDANSCLKAPLLQLASQAAEAGAVIVVEPLGEVHADSRLLGLAFHHLVDNAIKFRRPNVDPRIIVRSASDDMMWRVQISDNGVGVEAPYREKAFGMFHRLHGEGAFPGVGAGLAICRRIARRHRGGLTFLDPPKGACIELALPRHRATH